MNKSTRSTLYGLSLAASLVAGAYGQENASVAVPTIEVERYVVKGDARLSEGALTALLAPYAGGRRTLGQIDDAAHALEKSLHDRGYVFLRVVVPAQRPIDGAVQLEIIRFALGHVLVSGNEHFSDDNIRRSLPALVETDSPDLNSISRDLGAANANPAKQVAITFREGTAPETIDADVRVKDVDPSNIFVDYTSNRSLNPLAGAENLYRATIGYQNSNLFDRDQVVTLSYTTDPQNPADVGLYAAFYQIPLYGTGANLATYYTHSDVTSGRVQQGGGFFDISGRGDFYGIRATQALPRLGVIQQSVSVSLDEHYYVNSSTFEGQAIEPNVGTRPVTLDYAMRAEYPWGGYDARLDYATNISGGPCESNAAYLANGGVKGWSAWRYAADLNYMAYGWDYAARLKGQWSDDRLIAGEQFGLGGMYSVRGFEDREVSGDYGYSLNLEAEAPAMLLPQLRPMLFIDGGSAHARAADSTQNLLSAGVGLRYNYEKISVVLDIAHVFQRNTDNPVNVHDRMDLLVSYHF